MKPVRLALAVGIIAAAAVLTDAARRNQAHVADLAALPYRVNAWTGRDAPPLDAETLRVLAADAYLDRNYDAGAAHDPINLYVAYYGEQRPGVSIHSPLHCLPGTGWEPLDVGTIDAPFAAASAGRMRRMIIRKDRERAVVLYWYSVHGRMVANEIASKAWLLRDSIRLGRSDAALVRIVVPLAAGSDPREAERRGLSFARDVFPYLQQLWS